MHGQQAGAPAKLARALLPIASQEQSPRRFIAGPRCTRMASASGLIDDEHNFAERASREGGEGVADLLQGEGLLDHRAGAAGG
jgi:hypothetical protein